MAGRSKFRKMSTVKICTCKQCRLVKKRASKNYKKRIRRYLNRQRRKGTDGRAVTWMFA